jgi:hypothetical protein
MKLEPHIRKLFGMQPTPLSLSWEDWKVFDAQSKKDSAIGYYFIEVITNMGLFKESFVDLITLRTVRYKLCNFRRKTHVLRTTDGSIGDWYDLCERIPDALFTALIDFVEIECEHMNQFCGVPSYETGVDWLLHQKSHANEAGKQDYDDIIEAYYYAKLRPTLSDPYESTEDYTAIRAIIETRSNEETRHLTTIVRLRDYLWT